MAEIRYAAESLVAFATSLVERSGASADIARDVADVLVTGDLLGHTTHGLALLAPYLEPRYGKSVGVHQERSSHQGWAASHSMVSKPSGPSCSERKYHSPSDAKRPLTSCIATTPAPPGLFST